MQQLAWDYLQAHGTLTNCYLMASNGLNVKRSSAVRALLVLYDACSTVADDRSSSYDPFVGANRAQPSRLQVVPKAIGHGNKHYAELNLGFHYVLHKRQVLCRHLSERQ